MKDDFISRQVAIAYAISGLTMEIDGEKWIRTSEVRESLKTMPSALPKGHGDLIDRTALMNRPYETGGFVEWYDEIKYAPTIIEADTEADT